MPVIPDLSAPSVPTDFTWTAKEGEVAFDDTLDRFEWHIYSPEDAQQLVLKFHSFCTDLNVLMSDTTSSEGALAIMEIYNRVVKANNHVLGFTSEACRKSFHKNELKLPSELEKIQMAFNDIMAVNRGEFRRPIHGEIV